MKTKNWSRPRMLFVRCKFRHIEHNNTTLCTHFSNLSLVRVWHWLTTQQNGTVLNLYSTNCPGAPSVVTNPNFILVTWYTNTCPCITEISLILKLIKIFCRVIRLVDVTRFCHIPSPATRRWSSFKLSQNTILIMDGNTLSAGKWVVQNSDKVQFLKFILKRTGKPFRFVYCLPV